ncbi:MAG: ABC transporter permease subunit [Planctomycetota bacterium]
MSRSSTPLLCAALAALALFGFGPLASVVSPFLRDAFTAGPSMFLMDVYDARTLGLLSKTALLGLSAAGLAVLVGAPFGFLVARTDVPGAGFLRAAGIVPLILPPLVLAMTWTMLVPLRGPVMTALLLALATFPLVALFTARAFEQIDARREEAALLVGGLPAALRMELPLVLPSVLAGACLAFVFAVNDFSLADYVSSVGKKFGVYATEVFTASKVDGNQGRAAAIAAPLVGLSLLALIPALTLRRRGSAVVAGDFQRPAPLRLGRGRWAAFGFCALLVTLGALVPIARLAFEAGGGSRLFGSGSIRRAAWTQGGGAAQVVPPPAGPAALGAPTEQAIVDSAERRAAVAAAASAAARAATVRQLGGVAPAAGAPTGAAPAAGDSGAPTTFPKPSNSAAVGSFKRDSPEAVAAAAATAAAEAEAAAGKPKDRGPLGQRLAQFGRNLRGSFARALELSRGSLISSIVFGALAATLAVPLALILGHAAARRRRGRLMELLVVIPLAAPAILFGIGAIALWNHDLTARIYESGAIVVLLYVGRFLAFPTLALSRAAASVDERLEESAALAGTSASRRLFSIVTPALWPSLVGAWTMVFVLSIRELDAAILVPAANDTVLFRVFNAVHFGRDDFVSALCLLVVFVLLLPGLLWSLFARKRMEFLP